MASLSNSEPVAAAGVVTAITTLVASSIGLLVSFGVDVTEAQKTAIGAFVVAIIAIVALGTSWWARSHSTPVGKAEKAIDAAYVANPATTPKPTLN
jgi:predicted anti-sigma-YlaC factor YlaD